MRNRIINSFLVIGQIALLSLCLWVAIDRALWIYLAEQGSGQLHIILNTKKVEELQEEGLLSKMQQNKIRQIQKVKQFAEHELGLQKTNNYSHFYEQNGKPVLWMLTACQPFSFQEKTWTFPFIGNVSYKGFFNYQKAVLEKQSLKTQNYDTDISKVTAWSTLGFLPDPILSSMLQKDDGELAELIIHELTHATIYLSGQVDFNENFASFIGRKGALLFLEKTYGKNSDPVARYLKQIADEDTLKSFVLYHKMHLEHFYNTLNKQLSLEEKTYLKEAELNRITNKLYLLKIYDNPIKIKIATKIKLSQNAFFMSYNRYDAQYYRINTAFKKHSDNLRDFVAYVKKNKSID